MEYHVNNIIFISKLAQGQQNKNETTDTQNL